MHREEIEKNDVNGSLYY